MTNFLNQVRSLVDDTKLSIQLRVNPSNNVIEICHVENYQRGAFNVFWKQALSIFKSNGVKYIVLTDCSKTESDIWGKYDFIGEHHQKGVQRFLSLVTEYTNERLLCRAFDAVRCDLMEHPIFHVIQKDNLHGLIQDKEIIQSINPCEWISF